MQAPLREGKEGNGDLTRGPGWQAGVLSHVSFDFQLLEMESEGGAVHQQKLREDAQLSRPHIFKVFRVHVEVEGLARLRVLQKEGVVCNSKW